MDLKKIILLGALLTLTSAVQAESTCSYDTDCCYQPECCEIAVSAEYLYWNARISDLDYALHYDQGTTTYSDNVKNVCPGYDSGFRVGFEKECDCYSVGANYTWYRNSSGDTFLNSDGEIAGTRVIPDLSGLAQGIDIVYSNADWRLNYNYLNLYVASDNCLSNCVDYRTFGGFTCAFVDHRLTAKYADNTDLTGTSTQMDLSEQKIRMDSYGLSFGIAPTFHWNSCFNLFGSFSYDTLLTKTDRFLIYQRSASGEENLAEFCNIDEDCWNLVGVLNLAVGVSYIWNNCWCDQDVEFSLGYEYHNWFNTLGFIDLQAANGAVGFDRYLNDFGFDGLFVKVAASF